MADPFLFGLKPPWYCFKHVCVICACVCGHRCALVHTRRSEGNLDFCPGLEPCLRCDLFAVYDWLHVTVQLNREILGFT